MQIYKFGDDGRTDGQTYITVRIGAFRDFAIARATNFCNLSVNKLLCSTHEIHENRRNIRYTLPERMKEFLSVLRKLHEIFMLSTSMRARTHTNT